MPAEAQAATAAADLTGANAGLQRLLAPGRFAALLGLFVFAAFPEVWLGGQVFAFRDFGAFGFPLAHYYRETLGQGELPLWNPFNNLGLPFLAQWNTMVLYPPCLLYLVLPWPWAVTWFCLGHLFLAGLGMYFLAERWTRCRVSGAVAGVAYAFGGLTLNSLMWPNNIAALGWMPWVVLWTDRGIREGGRAWIVASLLGAMQVLSGAPEILAFTWAIVGLLWLAALWQGEVNRGRLVARVLGLGLVVLGLTAAQLLPFLELLRASQRDAGYGTSDWAMPAWGWANLLVPLFRCYPSPQGAYLQADQAWTSSYYAGVGVLALAVLAVRWARRSRVWMLAFACGLGLVLALGEDCWLYAALRQAVPVLGFMRFPVKFVVLAVFTLPVLAAFGLSAWLRAPREAQRQWCAQAGALAAVFLGVMLAVACVAVKHPYGQEDCYVTWTNARERAFWLCLILGASAGLALARRPNLQGVLALLVVVAVWLDGVTHAPSQNPTAHPVVFRPHLPPLQELRPKPELGRFRAMRSLRGVVEFSQRMLSDPSTNILCYRLRLGGNCNLLEGFPTADGFYSLYLKTERDIHLNAYLSTNEVRARLADFLGACQITDDQSPLEWLPRPTALPVITAGQRPVFVDGEAALARVLAPDFDPEAVVYLPTTAQGHGLTSSRTEARVLSQRFTAHEVSAWIRASAPAVVVIAQSYYPAWKATVDGQPVPLWRANHAFQAVPVPAGWHEVRLRYKDTTFRLGLVISLVTLAACLGGWWFIGNRQVPREPREGEPPGAT